MIRAFGVAVILAVGLYFLQKAGVDWVPYVQGFVNWVGGLLDQALSLGRTIIHSGGR